MDVVLDTNVFVSDFCMQKNQFANLFDYLRRTGSTLVICKVVWDEVLTNYAQRLKGDISRVTAAWEELSAVRFDRSPEPSLPDVEKQVEQLQKRLKAPAKGVEVTLYEDYSRVDINEIVRRGTRRIRPASNEGEELRDVILWLQALDYAKQKATEVVFVSNDGSFIEWRRHDREKY